MATIIDGYNLLHVTGIFGRGLGPGGLERSRNALLNMLAESIDPKEIPQTMIVFDAQDAPPGLPRRVMHRGITVRFAAEQSDADELIEELIVAHHAPRSLVIVSGDHRLHRAARRRKARPIDSDRWYAELLRKRHERGQKSASAKPDVPMTEADVEFWMRQFGVEPSEESSEE